jgi:hypothetical protein
MESVAVPHNERMRGAIRSSSLLSSVLPLCIADELSQVRLGLDPVELGVAPAGARYLLSDGADKSFSAIDLSLRV